MNTYIWFLLFLSAQTTVSTTNVSTLNKFDTTVHRKQIFPKQLEPINDLQFPKNEDKILTRLISTPLAHPSHPNRTDFDLSKFNRTKFIPKSIVNPHELLINTDTSKPSAPGRSPTRVVASPQALNTENLLLFTANVATENGSQVPTTPNYEQASPFLNRIPQHTIPGFKKTELVSPVDPSELLINSAYSPALPLSLPLSRDPELNRYGHQVSQQLKTSSYFPGNIGTRHPYHSLISMFDQSQRLVPPSSSTSTSTSNDGSSSAASSANKNVFMTSTSTIHGTSVSNNNNFYRGPSESLNIPVPEVKPSIYVNGVRDGSLFVRDLFPNATVNIICSRRHGCPIFYVQDDLFSSRLEYPPLTIFLNQMSDEYPTGNITINCDFQQGCPFYVIQRGTNISSVSNTLETQTQEVSEISPPVTQITETGNNLPESDTHRLESLLETIQMMIDLVNETVSQNLSETFVQSQPQDNSEFITQFMNQDFVPNFEFQNQMENVFGGNNFMEKHKITDTKLDKVEHDDKSIFQIKFEEELKELQNKHSTDLTRSHIPDPPLLSFLNLNETYRTTTEKSDIETTETPHSGMSHRMMMRYGLAGMVFGIPTTAALLTAIGAPIGMVAPLGLAIPALLTMGFTDVTKSVGGIGSHLRMSNMRRNRRRNSEGSSQNTQTGGNGLNGIIPSMANTVGQLSRRLGLSNRRRRDVRTDNSGNSVPSVVLNIVNAPPTNATLTDNSTNVNPEDYQKLRVLQQYYQQLLDGTKKKPSQEELEKHKKYLMSTFTRLIKARIQNSQIRNNDSSNETTNSAWNHNSSILYFNNSGSESTNNSYSGLQPETGNSTALNLSSILSFRPPTTVKPLENENPDSRNLTNSSLFSQRIGQVQNFDSYQTNLGANFHNQKRIHNNQNLGLTQTQHVSNQNSNSQINAQQASQVYDLVYGHIPGNNPQAPTINSASPDSTNTVAGFQGGLPQTLLEVLLRNQNALLQNQQRPTQTVPPIPVSGQTIFGEPTQFSNYNLLANALVALDQATEPPEVLLVDNFNLKEIQRPNTPVAGSSSNIFSSNQELSPEVLASLLLRLQVPQQAFTQVDGVRTQAVIDALSQLITDITDAITTFLQSLSDAIAENPLIAVLLALAGLALLWALLQHFGKGKKGYGSSHHGGGGYHRREWTDEYRSFDDITVHILEGIEKVESFIKKNNLFGIDTKEWI